MNDCNRVSIIDFRVSDLLFKRVRVDYFFSLLSFLS
jgi:hypothetical protein